MGNLILFSENAFHRNLIKIRLVNPLLYDYTIYNVLQGGNFPDNDWPSFEQIP